MAEHLVKLKDAIRDWGTLLTVLTFVIFQWSKIEKHENMLNAWSQVGTPRMVKMEATYEERFKNQNDRVERLETIAVSNNTGISDIKTELRGVTVELRVIKEQLQQHREESKGNP